MDAGHRETERKLEEIEKRISAEYRKAEKGIQKTLDEYLRKFETKDKLKQKALAEGKITEEEYKQWRIGQMMIGQRWNATRDRIVNDLNNASQEARNIAFNQIGDIYAANFNYGTYQVEKAARIDTDFTLYDKDAVRELIKNEDTFISAPGRKVRREINEGKQKAWDTRQVQSVMMQGILQGKSIPKLASDLAETVGEADRKAAIRNARTMVTGVQNAGRVASYERANEMGIETQKQWLAALDDRTRHWHAELDGEKVDNDEPFVNEYGEIMYPGDPTADPANIYNCRCTLIASIKGFERDVSDIGQRNDKLGDMSYEDWKAGHYEQKSDPITKQEEITETMQWAYGAEYKEYENLTGGGIDGNITDDNYLEQSSDASIPEKYDGDFSDYNELSLTETEEKAMRTLHDLSKKDDVEHLIVIKDGVASKPYDSGLEGRVKVPDSERDGNDIKLFHSHTNATPLSQADLQKFTWENVTSVGVIAVNGDTYVVNGYTVAEAEFAEAAESISREVNSDLMMSEDFETMTLEQRNYVATRETFYRICRYFEWEMQGGRYE